MEFTAYLAGMSLTEWNLYFTKSQQKEVMNIIFCKAEYYRTF